jgi:hypothetical protein
MNKLLAIPDFHFVFTDNGWERLSSITLDTVFLTFSERKIVWQKQTVFTKFHYSGILDRTKVKKTELSTEPSLLEQWENYVKFDEVVRLEPTSTFFTKGCNHFKTHLADHKIIKQEKINWEGTLYSFSFPILANPCISNKTEYFIL